MKKVIIMIAFFAIVSVTLGQTKNNSDQIPEKASSMDKPYYLNDTIWVLDSTLQQRIVDGEFINQSKRIIMSHDEQGRSTSSFLSTWYTNQESWKNSYYDSTTFHNSGQIFEKFGYSWNTNGNNWKITYYFKMLENYQFIEQFQKTWDNNKNKYIFGYHTRTEYNETGLPIIVYSDVLDSISQEFMINSRRAYFYNGNNEDTTQLWEKWDNQNQLWKAYRKKEIIYNDEGLPVQKLELDWVADSAKWINDLKKIASYNTEGLANTIEYYTWLHLYNMWYPSYRDIRFFDEQGRTVESVRQEDGYGDEVWVNVSRVLHVFENGKSVERRTQNWSSGNWVDDRIELITYINDTLIESQTFINYNPYEETYDTSTRWLTVFNERFIPEKFLIQGYSSETSEFITTSQWLYYFSPLAPQSVNEVEQLEFAIYPNPSTGIFQLTLPESEGNTRFIVSGLSGRVIYEGVTEATAVQIDLANNAKGIYFIRVISGNKQGVKKVVKF